MLTRRDILAVSLAFLLTLPALTTRLYASDEIQFFSWLHSWVFDRDVDFDNEYRHFYDNGTIHTDGFRDTFLIPVNENGRRFNFAPIGSAILWMPFYLAGHLVAVVTGSPADGYSAPYVAAVALGSALYGLCALLLSLAIAGRLGLGAEGWTTGHRPRAANWRSFSPAGWVLLGTPLIFYIYIAPGFSHACSAFAVALFLYLWLDARETWTMRQVVWMSAAGALMSMVREQDLFFLALPALDFVRHAWRQRQRGASIAPLVGPATAGVLTLLVVYAPQLAAYQALNGHPSQTDAVARKMFWHSPHFLEVLFSPRNGLFFWTPLAIVGLAGLLILAFGRARPLAPATRPAPSASTRTVAALLLIGFLLQVYISGSVDSWSVAGSFGQRRFLAITPLLVVGLAALAQATRTPGTMWLRRVVLILCVWWNVGLMAQFGLHVMDRQHLTLGANARWTFVDMPRVLPALAWRYLTNRSSFYGLPRE